MRQFYPAEIPYIRPIERHEVPTAVEIITENFGNEWDQLAMEDIMAMWDDIHLRPIWYGAFMDGVLLGIIGLVPAWVDYNFFQGQWLCVRKAYQKQGLGKLLMNHLIEEIRLRGKDFPGNMNAPKCLLISTADHNIDYYISNWGFKVIQHIEENRNLMTLIIG